MEFKCTEITMRLTCGFVSRARKTIAWFDDGSPSVEPLDWLAL